MAPIARIFGLSLLAGGLGTGLGFVFFGHAPYNEYIIPIFFLGCVGGIIGAIAGAAREVATALAKSPSCLAKPTQTSRLE